MILAIIYLPTNSKKAIKESPSCCGNTVLTKDPNCNVTDFATTSDPSSISSIIFCIHWYALKSKELHIYPSKLQTNFPYTFITTI